MLVLIGRFETYLVAVKCGFILALSDMCDCNGASVCKTSTRSEYKY